ncbi:hypothetical protein [Sandaracinobacteroides saxicola]|uniref:Lipoprotein n=1 Tax=Sandaracinobacteroides saxicola TaxID=2759707 RepID=A0A7G5IIU9_9SPHN|nr:hypothetical protein [Sandaracinobacteroides saxicola]QMW23291.1 hypothetical protein H3309_01910 [Sandaracinobacteroides saxicola]
MKPALVLLLLLLSACGHKGALVRATDDSKLTNAQVRAMKKEEGAATMKALIPPAQAAPKRVDDGAVPSGVRQDDPFNLPPADTVEKPR